MRAGYPKHLEFIYKILCIYFYMFKPQSPSKYSPFGAIHPSRCFFHCSKQFLNSVILMPFSTSAIFCFASSTSAKHFPLRTLFIQETTTTKKLLGERSVEWGVGARESCCLWSKTAEHSKTGVGRCICKSPIMKWANPLKDPSKKIHWSQMQPLTTMPAGTLIQMGS